MHSKPDVICSKNMLIGKCVIIDWLAVAWERSAGNGKQWLLTILSWETFDFKIFCMGRDGKCNY